MDYVSALYSGKCLPITISIYLLEGEYNIEAFYNILRDKKHRLVNVCHDKETDTTPFNIEVKGVKNVFTNQEDKVTLFDDVAISRDTLLLHTFGMDDNKSGYCLTDDVVFGYVPNNIVKLSIGKNVIIPFFSENVNYISSKVLNTILDYLLKSDNVLFDLALREQENVSKEEIIKKFGINKHIRPPKPANVLCCSSSKYGCVVASKSSSIKEIASFYLGDELLGVCKYPDDFAKPHKLFYADEDTVEYIKENYKYEVKEAEAKQPSKNVTKKVREHINLILSFLNDNNAEGRTFLNNLVNFSLGNTLTGGPLYSTVNIFLNYINPNWNTNKLDILCNSYNNMSGATYDKICEYL